MSETQGSQVLAKATGKASRLFAVDALRGLIIVVMALDHANHFIAQKHPPSEIWDGVFPVYYDVVAFLTRLVTHVAAPLQSVLDRVTAERAVLTQELKTLDGAW